MISKRTFFGLLLASPLAALVKPFQPKLTDYQLAIRNLLRLNGHVVSDYQLSKIQPITNAEEYRVISRFAFNPSDADAVRHLMEWEKLRAIRTLEAAS